MLNEKGECANAQVPLGRNASRWTLGMFCAVLGICGLSIVLSRNDPLPAPHKLQARKVTQNCLLRRSKAQLEFLFPSHHGKVLFPSLVAELQGEIAVGINRERHFPLPALHRLGEE